LAAERDLLLHNSLSGVIRSEEHETGWEGSKRFSNALERF